MPMCCCVAAALQGNRQVICTLYRVFPLMIVNNAEDAHGTPACHAAGATVLRDSDPTELLSEGQPPLLARPRGFVMVRTDTYHLR